MRNSNDIKVIFLDAGGVLFDTFTREGDRIRYLLKERGYKISEIDAAILKANDQRLRFFVTNWNEEEHFYKGFYKIIAEELGDPQLVNELFYFTHYANHCELFPDVKGILEILSKNYRLAVISNAMPSMDWIFDRLGIRKYFESLILSSFVKEEKPGEEIFKIALKQLKVNKDECIFIDDITENIEGAARVGIKGLHLDREKQSLLELLKEQKIFAAKASEGQTRIGG